MSKFAQLHGKVEFKKPYFRWKKNSKVNQFLISEFVREVHQNTQLR